MLASAAPLILLDPLYFGWIQILGTFTMYPLLKKDLLQIPYIVCCVLYMTLVYLFNEIVVEGNGDNDVVVGNINGDNHSNNKSDIGNNRFNSVEKCQRNIVGVKSVTIVDILIPSTVQAVKIPNNGSTTETIQRLQLERKEKREAFFIILERAKYALIALSCIGDT